MKTVTLEVIQPSTGPVCPGQEIILTCTVTQADANQLFLNWNLKGFSSLYDLNNPQSGPHSFGDFITTAIFMTATDSKAIISNATLKSAGFINNGNVVACDSPPQDNVQTTTIAIAGNDTT